MAADVISLSYLLPRGKSVEGMHEWLLAFVRDKTAEGNRCALGRFAEFAAANSLSGRGVEVSGADVAAAVCELLRNGLLYVDISSAGNQPSQWRLRLTEAGRAAADDDRYNPISMDQYVAALRADVPDVSELALLYLRESLSSFAQCLYLASTVMLGVSAEAVFVELARAAVTWLGAGGKKLAAMLDGPRVTMSSRIEEFQKRVVMRKDDIPTEAQAALHVPHGTLLHLIRMNRNASGHPSGVIIRRGDQANLLRLFPAYCANSYALRRLFLDSAAGKEAS